MRIALTITELHPGGAEKCFVNLARFLSHQGHDVAVWQLWPDPPRNRRHLTDQLDLREIPWHSGGAKSAWHFPGVARWLRSELRNYAPDVVQSFLFHANVASAYAAGPLRCPFFGGVRVSQPQRLRSWMQYWASRRMQKMICVSESVASHCKQVEGVPASKIIVIPNGIELDTAVGEQTDWNEFGLPSDARVCLFVGRLDRQKGILELARDADRFLEKLPEHHVVILGEGPLREELQSAKNHARYGNRIHLVGWHPEPLGWMQRCEMLLLPAKYEGMPNVVLEAMSAGTPVVTFDVDGVRELLGDSELSHYQIVAEQDFVQFAESILYFANSPATRRQCSAFNIARVEEHFMLKDQLARYEELYLSTDS